MAGDYSFRLRPTGPHASIDDMAKSQNGKKGKGAAQQPKPQALSKSRNSMPQKDRAAMCALLNHALADLSDLSSQVKQAHWNVKGPQFIALHELFDKLHGELSAPIDDVAERVTSLGGFARGTVRMDAGASRIKELPQVTDAVALLAALADRYASVGARIREAIEEADDADDVGTEDLLTGIVRTLDKGLWFLEAHLA